VLRVEIETKKVMDFLLFNYSFICFYTLNTLKRHGITARQFNRVAHLVAAMPTVADAAGPEALVK
jgi:hypothetical protein